MPAPYFFPVTAFRLPFRVRQLFLVLWPRQGSSCTTSPMHVSDPISLGQTLRANATLQLQENATGVAEHTYDVSTSALASKRSSKTAGHHAMNTFVEQCPGRAMPR